MNIFLKKISPYYRLARLNKPIGIWLLLLPTLFNITFTTKQIPLEILLIFIIGSVIMRSAGCVINDIWDKEIDSQVSRTKLRPLAAGEVSLTGAIIFFMILSLIGLYLLLKLNTNTIYLGILFLGMVICYPLMKKIISIPQIFLGLTFNAGVLMSAMALNNSLNISAWLLYAAGFFWTLSYDTVYAHQDKKDDVKIGIKSSALFFGKHTKINLTIYYSLMFILLAIVTWINNLGTFFYASLLITLVITLNTIKNINLNSPQQCHKFFINNSNIAWLLLSILLLNKWYI